MSNIFISYSSEDREKARQLAHALEQEGWSVWWDRNIAAGKSYQRVIEAELDAAACAIVIWSKNSVYSDWVVAEAEEGRARSILVPVSIDDAKPPLVFRQIQTADLSDWQGDPSSADFRQLVNDIRPLISDPATEASAPPGPESSAKPRERAKPTDPTDGNRIKWVALAVVVLIGVGALVALAYIQGWFKPVPEPEPAAEILNFSAEPGQIKEGEAVTLSWSTVNAVQVTIGSAEDTHGETTEKSGSKVVYPTRTTQFVLTAKGKNPGPDTAAERRTVAVEVLPPATQEPRIVAFETDRRILIRGDSTALHWEAIHAVRVELDDAAVNPRGDIKVRPEQTTTYRLEVFNESGSADSRTLTITVEGLPRDEISEIQELLGLLGYDAGTADGLPGPRTRAAVEAFQNENGLTATGLPSRDLADRLREIHSSTPAPEIVVFKSDRLKIKKGESLNLFWETVNADRINLNPLGQVQPSGERSVQPPATTEYELLAFNRIGRSVRKTIAIQVEVPLGIESLTVDRQRIEPKDKTTIRWRTSGADQVELMPFGEVSLSGSRMISPDKTTRYELVATNAAGEKTSRRIEVEVGCSPSIDSFQAGSGKINSGAETRLVWSTSCTDKVYILPWSKEYLEPTGSINITPDKTTSYTLTALGPDGRRTSKTVTITVQSASATDRFLVLAGAGKELNDPRVINAIQIGMPLQNLVEKFVGRSRNPRAFFEIPLGSKRVNASDFSYSSKNIARSKQLLAEAGYPDGIKAMLLYTGRTRDLTKAVSDIFNRIGIGVSVKSVLPARARRAVEAYAAKSGQATFLLELKE